MFVIHQLQVSFRVNSLKTEAVIKRFFDLPGTKAYYLVVEPTVDRPTETRVEMYFRELRDYAVRVLLHKLEMLEQWRVNDLELRYLKDDGESYYGPPSRLADDFQAAKNKGGWSPIYIPRPRGRRDASRPSRWIVGAL
ncbi:MAG TPA: hypothetical protein VFS42_05675 [Burkholderiaceae bacterium]|nr:hypothetical protein [Burkholderiaceae bacterium]